MSAPTLSSLGERLRERTEPLAPEDDQHGYAHAHLSEALMLPLERVAEIYDPPDPLPPGAPLVSLAHCPDWALPWLAQLVGVRLPAGVPPAVARELIQNVAGWARGTPDSLRHAAGLYLTDSKTVYFRERDEGDPYRLDVVTLTGETPDPAAVLRALLAQKPGGIVLTYRQIETWDYQAQAIEGGTYEEQSSLFADYASLTLNERL